jgi:hypothetical protein
VVRCELSEVAQSRGMPKGGAVNLRVAGGSRKEGQPSIKHCRACGETGHNAQTCPDTIEVVALTNSE